MTTYSIDDIKKLVQENEQLKKEKAQILSEIKNTRLRYSEYEGVWNSLTKIIDEHTPLTK